MLQGEIPNDLRATTSFMFDIRPYTQAAANSPVAGTVKRSASGSTYGISSSVCVTPRPSSRACRKTPTINSKPVSVVSEMSETFSSSASTYRLMMGAEELMGQQCLGPQQKGQGQRQPPRAVRSTPDGIIMRSTI